MADRVAISLGVFCLTACFVSLPNFIGYLITTMNQPPSNLDAHLLIIVSRHEMDRKDMKHQFPMLIIQGGPHLAPIRPSSETIPDTQTDTDEPRTLLITMLFTIPSFRGFGLLVVSYESFLQCIIMTFFWPSQPTSIWMQRFSSW